MKILYFTSKPPIPAVDGGSRCAAGDISVLLGLGHEVRVFSLTTPKHPAGRPEPGRSDCPMESFPIRPRLSPASLLLARRTSGGYPSVRFWAGEAEDRLGSILDSAAPDAVLVDGVSLGRYLPVLRRRTGAPVILRAQNIESDLWRQRFRNPRSLLGRLASPLFRSFAGFERGVWDAVDGVACLSPEMAQRIRGASVRGIIRVIPPAVESRNGGEPPADDDLAFLGAMDWWPNREGIRWFFRHVHPLVLKAVPGFRFHFAGRDSLRFARRHRLPPGVVPAGEVADAASFLLRHRFVAAPLLSGSGLRIKIIEAMNLGRVVIATPAAAAGLPFRAGEDLLIGESGREMADHIIRCLNRPREAEPIGTNASRAVRRTMSFPAVAPLWAELLENRMARKL
ncbi:MAG: glycosyltransferase [Candidatus Aminicenantales bacterium]